MGTKTLIIVGGRGVDQSFESDAFFEIKKAASCCEVEHLLKEASTADLVCTDVILPDGNWCDVLRLIVQFRIEAEVRVLGQDGQPVLRLETRRNRTGSMRALNSALRKNEVLAASVGGAA